MRFPTRNIYWCEVRHHFQSHRKVNLKHSGTCQFPTWYFVRECLSSLQIFAQCRHVVHDQIKTGVVFGSSAPIKMGTAHIQPYRRKQSTVRVNFSIELVPVYMWFILWVSEFSNYNSNKSAVLQIHPYLLLPNINMLHISWSAEI